MSGAVIAQSIHPSPPTTAFSPPPPIPTAGASLQCYLGRSGREAEHEQQQRERGFEVGGRVGEEAADDLRAAHVRHHLHHARRPRHLLHHPLRLRLPHRPLEFPRPRGNLRERGGQRGDGGERVRGEAGHGGGEERGEVRIQQLRLLAVLGALPRGRRGGCERRARMSGWALGSDGRETLPWPKTGWLWGAAPRGSVCAWLLRATGYKRRATSDMLRAGATGYERQATSGSDGRDGLRATGYEQSARRTMVSKRSRTAARGSSRISPSPAARLRCASSSASAIPKFDTPHCTDPDRSDCADGTSRAMRRCSSLASSRNDNSQLSPSNSPSSPGVASPSWAMATGLALIWTLLFEVDFTELCPVADLLVSSLANR
ncbi:unnamed protein product [Closterium sp. NIES-54]